MEEPLLYKALSKMDPKRLLKPIGYKDCYKYCVTNECQYNKKKDKAICKDKCDKRCS